MKFYAILALATFAFATDHGSTYGGSGPYKSYYFEVETLPNHTFYQPMQSGADHGSSKLKLPVIVWGNGACDPCTYLQNLNLLGLKFRNFLGEVSSWGALAIATGPAFIDPSDYVEEPSDPNNPASRQNPGSLTGAIDWVYANAGKGQWKHIDRTRIGVWGQSCGGLEAYTAGAQDKRVGHLAIFNSGQLDDEASETVAGSIEKPVFYILGGPTDVAYPHGERDYAGLPSKTPAWKGNHALGHSAAFDVPNAGIPGVAGRYILRWLLRGDTEAKTWFISGGAKKTGFTDVVFKNLGKIKVNPI